MVFPRIFTQKIDESLSSNYNNDTMKNYIRQAPLIFPRPNHDVEFIVPLFNAKKHYKHLKKMMWKYRR